MTSTNRAKKYRKYLGPSQYAIALGLDEYQTAETLRSEIENGYVPSDSYATRFGNDNESVAKYFYQKIFGRVIDCASFMVDKDQKRFGGICDGLIGADTGIEIKCHVRDENLLKKIPLKYLIQLAGYMYLYKRSKWILMSCIFNTDQTVKKYVIHEVTWSQVEKQWTEEWYPKLIEFVNQTKWVT
jgi:predicted phage-related endonuclease